jgi:hypothetical protein
MGLIGWFAKDFREDAATRGVLIGTLIADIVSLVVVVMGTMAGTMNALGWFAALIYLLRGRDADTSLWHHHPRLSPR